MKYVSLDAQVGDLTGVLDPRRYLRDLPSFARELPPGARTFATDAAHYDFHSSRCVKDLTVSLLQRSGEGELVVEFRHNCWKHDRDLVIRYTGVSSFAVDLPADERGRHRGTVILDEILPHQEGCSHEIACWEGSLTLVCRDLRASWTQATCSNEC
ncbi:hypothetical protein [Streptomyces lonarensis]|uniref:Uncharacterized protein n=1 Tax=Streptomyces lonarensis TaxID=700599 RepID=A0A7X6CYS7_9ACTN|nr:hypothetical protein [Streptomyces lonarensis]NJQ04883.1 hypothetical protein [Streptomyces lonarensis]